MATPTVTEDNLGAWLLRCNPEVWDLPSFIEDGNDTIGSWTVVRNYRSQMMAEGQRVILWATGDGRRIARGVWGLGYVMGATHDDIPDEVDFEGLGADEPDSDETGSDEADVDDADSDDIGYWLDEAAAAGADNAVPVDIQLLEEPITDEVLRAAGITDLEVQRQPQGSNPSWVSKDQLARLDLLLGDWPERTEPVRQVTISSDGAGFGSPLQNMIVERAAMAEVRRTFEAEGWTVVDVSDVKCGWDLTCRRQTREEKVEVKGVTGDRPAVFLTANELRAAEEHEGWMLAVVTRAVSAPKVRTFTSAQAWSAARPYVYKADLSSAL